MREVVLRPEAARDIENIADYTIEQWGHDQARKYVGELRQVIETLASDGLRHPLSNLGFVGLRRRRNRHHQIYYLIDGTTVDVVRILHERMDIEGQLR